MVSCRSVVCLGRPGHSGRLGGSGGPSGRGRHRRHGLVVFEGLRWHFLVEAMHIIRVSRKLDERENPLRGATTD